MKFEQALQACTAIANGPGPMEEGGMQAFVFKNAVVVYSMEPGRHLKITVAASEPTIINDAIDDLLEPAEGEPE
jgi:hypothetical protein